MLFASPVFTRPRRDPKSGQRTLGATPVELDWSGAESSETPATPDLVPRALSTENRSGWVSSGSAMSEPSFYLPRLYSSGAEIGPLAWDLQFEGSS